MPSSNSSLQCRIDWQPSRMLAASLAVLGLLAGLSLLLGNAPKLAAIVASMIAVAYGLYLARRELQRQPRVLLWSAGASELQLEYANHSEIWREPRAIFRGSLVTVVGTDDAGHQRQLHWWPDTLPASARRCLRLTASTAKSA